MNRLLITAFLGFVVAAPNAAAAVSDEDIAQLREQLLQMSQRLDKLEAENAELRQAQTQADTTTADVESNVTEVRPLDLSQPQESWPERVRMDGDFRYRYERFAVDNNDSRSRNRIRARTNVIAKVASHTEIGFGLATGGDDPVSTNQTLGGGGSSKSIALNLAYVDWEALDGLHLIAGKYKNPLLKAGGQPLLWDGDWTPEGLAVKYQNERFFVNGFGSYLESDSGTSNDSFAWGAQIGMSGDIGDVQMLGGVSYYSIEAAGKTTTFGDPSNPDDFFGNTAVEPGGQPCGSNPGTACVFLNDYLLTEVFAEATFDLAGMPLTVFGDYVSNSDVSINNTGWTLGAQLGQAKDRGQWQFTYYYADKQADALLGLVTDSDFGGGGTDNKGHWMQVNYGVNKNWTIGAQYFINETDLASGIPRDFDRLMIDMQWRWR